MSDASVYRYQIRYRVAQEGTRVFFSFEALPGSACLSDFGVEANDGFDNEMTALLVRNPGRALTRADLFLLTGYACGLASRWYGVVPYVELFDHDVRLGDTEHGFNDPDLVRRRAAPGGDA